MSLNLITVAYNYEYLDKLFYSILSWEDVEWTIVKVKDRNMDKWRNIYRINIIEVDTSEDLRGGFIKMQAGLDSIKSGWFMKLDEDTIFHKNAYFLYKKYKELPGMIIGNQHYCNEKIRLPACKPYEGALDSGNVLCHSECLKEVKWGENTNDLCPDNTFWLNCFHYYRIGRTLVVNEPISYYNYQKNQIEA